jgi:hypothetical protein
LVSRLLDEVNAELTSILDLDEPPHKIAQMVSV